MPAVTNNFGTDAGVTPGNRLMTSSVMRTSGEANAVEQGWAFVCADIITPTGAADVFCRIANLSADNLIITKIAASAASAETMTIQTAANYTSATSHTDRTATNRLAGSANLFTTKGTFEADVDITGDSGAVDVGYLGMGVAETQYELDLHGSELVIPNGYSLLLESITGAVEIKFAVYCHFDMVPRVNG